MLMFENPSVQKVPGMVPVLVVSAVLDHTTPPLAHSHSILSFLRDPEDVQYKFRNENKQETPAVP